AVAHLGAVRVGAGGTDRGRGLAQERAQRPGTGRVERGGVEPGQHVGLVAAVAGRGGGVARRPRQRAVHARATLLPVGRPTRPASQWPAATRESRSTPVSTPSPWSM